ncbi:MAG: septum formation initiator family protein [Bryobacteraceae bacterium]
MLSSILRPLAAVAALAGLAAYATITLRGPQGIRALEERRREIRILEEQNANLQRDLEAKKQRIDRLKTDPSAQEVVIRERLGKVHAGDTDFKIPGQHAPAQK